MPHLEQDQLVLLAFTDEATASADEPGDGSAAAHLAACAECRADVASLRAVAALGRETRDILDLPRPPERLWDRIAAEATGASAISETVNGHRGAGATTPPAPRSDADPGPAPSVGRGSAGDQGPATALDSGSARDQGPAPATDRGSSIHQGPATALDEVSDRRARRAGRTARRWVAPLVAAAAAAAIAIAGTVVVMDAIRPSTSTPPPVKVTARVDLDPLQGAPTGIDGYVRLLADGRLHVHVDGAIPPPGANFEVWLIDLSSAKDPTGLKMKPLGFMAGQNDQIFPLDPGWDLAKYNLVDISAEPDDGISAHSGNSLLRATLPIR